MAEEEKPIPTAKEAEEASVDLMAIPEDIRRIFFVQENRLTALEDLALQMALDLKTLATALNAVQQHVTGLRHEHLRRDLEQIHQKWLALLQLAERQGRIKLARPSSLVLPDGVKPN